MPIITALILSIVASCFTFSTSAWSHPAPELCVSRWVTATGWNCDHHCDHLASCPRPTTSNPFSKDNPPPDLSDLETPYACIDPPDGVCHDYCDTCTFTSEPDPDPVDPVVTDPVDPVVTDPVDPVVTDPVDPVVTDPVDPVVTDPKYFIDSPIQDSRQSGLGMIHGWVCSIRSSRSVRIWARRADTMPWTHKFRATYGSARADTHNVCGDTNNGFG